MADILWSDVTSMFASDAALAALPVPAQDVILARVNRELSARFFGGVDAPRFLLARIYMAAHMATSGGINGAAAAGPVIARSEGGVSEQYASSSSAIAGSHSSTGYGRQFDELVRVSPYRIGVTT